MGYHPRDARKRPDDCVPSGVVNAEAVPDRPRQHPSDASPDLPGCCRMREPESFEDIEYIFRLKIGDLSRADMRQDVRFEQTVPVPGILGIRRVGRELIADDRCGFGKRRRLSFGHFVSLNRPVRR